MTISSTKQKYQKIPTSLTKKQFRKFILPHLSMPKRGAKCKIGYYRAFNYILKVNYTGAQWKELAIERRNGKAEIHYTTIYKLFARWSQDGSLAKAFEASVKHLAKKNKLDTSILHGDGTNTVAKKGGDGIGYSGHKHQNGEKVMAIVERIQQRHLSFKLLAYTMINLRPFCQT